MTELYKFIIFKIIILILLILYLISKKQTVDKGYVTITPQTLYNMFNLKNIAIVNTLSDNILINRYPISITNSYGKNFINIKNIEKFDNIILYCANYTCGASHKYAYKLLNKNIPKNKIILYSGGIHEWSKYSILYPDNFVMIDTETNTLLNKEELRDIVVDFSHFSESKKHIDYGYNFPKILINNSASNNFYNNLRIPKELVNNSKLLNGKVCVVTGGTSGLGLSVVYSMLNNGAKHVTLTYYNNKERAERVKNILSDKYDPNRFFVLRADARTLMGNRLTFDNKIRREKLNLNHGGINCVDINAGIFGPANMNKKHVHNISEEDFDKVIKINLKAYFLGIKFFVKQAIENNISDGSIVCIKSIYGSTGSLFSNIAYQTSKHGVMGLVRQSAIELARENKKLKIKYPIRINAVSPTFTDTALTYPLLKSNLVEKTIRNGNPTGNLARKADIANAVIYLLSDNSRSITGIDLPVDCGVLAESIPTYEEVKILNNSNIEELSCCGSVL